MNAVVLGVSSNVPAEHRRFISKYDLKIELLSDPNREVMRQYGAWVTSQLGDRTTQRVVRSTVIIAPDGTVAEHYPEVIPKGHAKRVRDRVAELQASST